MLAGSVRGFGSPEILKRLAQVGLAAKGAVYTLLGILAFMAAFELGGQQENATSKQGVLKTVQDATGGNILLAVIALGLFCYSVWRLIEGFNNGREAKNDKKKAAKSFRYFFSGLVYFSLAVYAGKMVLGQKDGGGGSRSDVMNSLTGESYGQIILIVAALVLAGVGVYQAFYGLSEKYRKHVSELNTDRKGNRLLLRSGKVGYVARGVVWLLLAWLMLQAAFNARSKEAADTSEAFQFLESSPFGSWLLGALALGLVCYGFFSFVRARYQG